MLSFTTCAEAGGLLATGMKCSVSQAKFFERIKIERMIQKAKSSVL